MRTTYNLYEILSVMIIGQTNHLTVLLPLLIYIPTGAQLIHVGSLETYLPQNIYLIWIIHRS